MPPPDIGKPAVQLFYQVLDCDMLRELRAGGIAMLLHPKMRAEAFKHLNDPCRSALGKNVHLQIEMIPRSATTPMRFCFIRMNAAIRTPSSEVIADNNG